MCSYNIEEIINKIDNDTETSDDILIALKSKHNSAVGLAMLKLIDKKYDDILILNQLETLSKFLKNSKFIGGYQYGHVAIAVLFLINSPESIKKFNQLYNQLNDSDQFWVNDFIELYTK